MGGTEVADRITPVPSAATSAVERRKAVLAALVLALAISAIILLRALRDPTGYLTPDSTHYLALATNLGRGLGLRVANSGLAPAAYTPLGEWPVGYPVVLHVTAALFHVTPFAASKLLAMLLVAGAGALIAAVSGRHGAICALPLGFGGALAIFSSTWSEGPFIALLLLAAVLLSGLLGSLPERRPWAPVWRSFGLAACCLGLFLVRYVGAFSLSLLGLALCVSLGRRAYRLAALQTALLLVVAALIGLYLHHNAEVTGFATGMPRTPPTDTWSERLAMLAGALWSELVLPLAKFHPGRVGDWLVAAVEAIALAALAVVIARRHRQMIHRPTGDRQTLAFALVGALNLGAIIVLRWRNQFDPYDFRLLGPGTLLLEVAALRLALARWPEAVRAIGAFAAGMVLLSILLAVAALPRWSAPGYLATARAIEQRYAAVPDGAIVVFGDDHLLYLRPGLFVALPLCRPWFGEDQSWDSFVEQLDWSHPVYVDMTGRALQLQGCQPSVRDFLARHRPGELFRLTPPPAGAALRQRNGLGASV